MTERRKSRSGGQRTAAKRQAEWRQRIAEAGEKKVCVVVPVECEQEIRDIAQRMRETTRARNPDATD